MSGLFVVLAVATFVLGAVGLRAASRQSVTPPGVLALASAMIGLYANQTPAWVQPGTSLPLTYQIAKVTGPLSTGYALASTAAVLLSNQLRLLRARLARGHSVVAGGSSVGVALTRALARDRLAVLVDVDAGSAATSASLVRRSIALAGDPRDDLVLRRAGVFRAREVFAFADSDEVNASIVVAALGSAAGRASRLTCYALVDDVALHLTLQSRILTRWSEAVALHVLDRAQLYASAVVTREGPAGGRAAVVGSGGTARSLALELARHLARPGAPPGSARLYLYGADAPSTASTIRERWGTGPGVPEVLSDPSPEGASEDRRPADELATHVFVSEPDGDRATLRTGLGWLQRRPGTQRVVLCMDGETGLTSTSSEQADQLFAGSTGVLAVYSPLVGLADPDHVRNQSFAERMARRLHDVYRSEVAGTTPSGSPEALLDWADLPETLRDANRSQAVEIGRKVTALGLLVVPAGRRSTRLPLSPAQVEQLAELEHERWMAERLSRGYRLGPRRTATEHPDLVPWDRLGETAREKDRVFVRRIPELLATEGLDLVPDPLASAARASADRSSG